MKESEDICSPNENESVKIISRKFSIAEDQNQMVSEPNCLLTNKINTYLDYRKAEENASNFEEKLIPKPGNASYFDLSKQNLKSFPVYLYEHCIYIKFLYLEGNFINELDDNFFPSLMNIKWLDIRNNLLGSLPKNISNHQNLEVLLLQDNKLMALPLELGLVPKLRGLQVLGNPLEFPPKEVVEKGAKNIIEYLQEEQKIQAPSPTSIRPIGENFYKGLEAKDTVPMIERKLKSKSGNAILKKRPVVKIKRAASANFPTVKSYQLKIPEPRAFVSKSVYRLGGKMSSAQSDCTLEANSFKHLSRRIENVGKNILQLRPTSVSTNYRKSRMEAKIQDVLLKEQLIAKIKELMEKQLSIIQKWKDEETLKNWRRNGKFDTMQRDAVGEPPFGIDLELMGNAGSAARARKKVQEGNIVWDVQEEMSEIFQSLQKLGNTSKNADISPRTQQNLLCNEIQTIMDLQKKLQALKLRNPRQGLPPPVPSLPVRGQKVTIEQQ